MLTAYASLLLSLAALKGTTPGLFGLTEHQLDLVQLLCAACLL